MKFVHLYLKIQNYLRGIGETTDVVQKEMYTFSTGDHTDQTFTLRPENTASAVRAYLENKVYGKEEALPNGFTSDLCSVMINHKQGVTVNSTNLGQRY